MKYQITHSCGCVEEVQLYGKSADRERKIAWLESKPCIDCAAKEVNNAADMAQLNGSAKQINWAASIRNDMIADMEKCRRQMMRQGEKMNATKEQIDAVNANIDKTIECIKGETSASWFINNRTLAADSIAKYFLTKK